MPPSPDPAPSRFPALRDPSVRGMLGLFTIAAMVLLGYEMEPLLTFRPVDAQIVGAGVAHVNLEGTRAQTFHAYQSEIFYRYQVAGVSYVGRQYRRADLELSSEMAEWRTESFAPGQHVRAWYNPRHPDEAVLHRSLNTELLVLVGIVVGMIWIAALTLRPESAVARSDSPRE